VACTLLGVVGVSLLPGSDRIGGVTKVYVDRRTDICLEYCSTGCLTCSTLPSAFSDCFCAVAYPGIFFRGGVSTNSVEDRGQRERGSGGGSPLVRGSGGSCNLVQEISFHIVKFS